MIKEKSIAPLSRILSLPASLQYIAKALQNNKQLKPFEVVRVIKEAKVQIKDLEPWADFDHPVTDSYGRKLVHDGGHFEIMVMSWRPGDFSAIHDHGFTQWGAVQIFGQAEHATFRIEDGILTTINRWLVTPGDVIGVNHDLIHQMGNPTSDKFFLSLHVYGSVQEMESITGDARIFDPLNQNINLVDGGVFFALPKEEIKTIKPGPKSNFSTRLRYLVEWTRRLRKIIYQQPNENMQLLEAAAQETFSEEQKAALIKELQSITNENGHNNNTVHWRILNWELKEAAKLQKNLQGEQRTKDHFHQYAEVYDDLICKPCFDGFIRRYILFFAEKYNLDFPNKSLLSLGCGTGLIETFFQEELGISYEKLYGIDISEAMVQVAQKRIQADVGDILTLDPSIRMWDIAFSGLNVFQYLPPERLEEAIQKAASVIQPGGYFLGDFITPDHIRWYPNNLNSKDKNAISVRTAKLVEDDGRMLMESEITNIYFLNNQMHVNYAGKHRRFLAPMNRIRNYFEKAFGGPVELYDAYSLALIPESADSCASTRYLVIAQKA